MRALSLLTVALGLFALPAFAATGSTSDTDTRRFLILRDGEPIGEHRVTVRREGTRVTVATEIEMEVYLAFLKVFHYSHRALETWSDGTLIAFESSTNDDGTLYSVAATRDDDVLKVEGKNGEARVPLGVIPTSYWNKALTSQDQLLNTQTGGLLPARVERQGIERIQAGGKQIEATRYTLTSDFALDLWYDAQGQWVKSRFDARGSSIEYVLQGASAPLQGASLNTTAASAFD
ncbi:MAG: hypothetical protein GC199_08720 [Alphaproteobacteria bacterium]|nr:hypothetical protein [Alphaproteobacteria bacterium]